MHLQQICLASGCRILFWMQGRAEARCAGRPNRSCIHACVHGPVACKQACTCSFFQAHECTSQCLHPVCAWADFHARDPYVQVPAVPGKRSTCGADVFNDMIKRIERDYVVSMATFRAGFAQGDPRRKKMHFKLSSCMHFGSLVTEEGAPSRTSLWKADGITRSLSSLHGSPAAPQECVRDYSYVL